LIGGAAAGALTKILNLWLPVVATTRVDVVAVDFVDVNRVLVLLSEVWKVEKLVEEVVVAVVEEVNVFDVEWNTSVVVVA
jgi:hypothetical protein